MRNRCSLSNKYWIAIRNFFNIAQVFKTSNENNEFLFGVAVILKVGKYFSVRIIFLVSEFHEGKLKNLICLLLTNWKYCTVVFEQYYFMYDGRRYTQCPSILLERGSLCDLLHHLFDHWWNNWRRDIKEWLEFSTLASNHITLNILGNIEWRVIEYKIIKDIKRIILIGLRFIWKKEVGGVTWNRVG